MHIWFLNLSTFRKLVLSFGSMVAITIGAGLLTYESVDTIRASVGWTQHTADVIKTLERVVASMVDQETGLRGYLVSGDEKFLDPYKSGLVNYNDAMSHVRSLTSDSAAQQTRLNDVDQLSRQWHEKVADAEIALMRNAETQNKARALESSGAGKASMDGIRAAVADTIKVENDLMRERLGKQVDAFEAPIRVIIGSTIASIFVAMVFAGLLNNGLSTPLLSMASAMKRLSTGDMKVEVPFANRRDEIGAMAESVRVFKESMERADHLAAEVSQSETMRRSEREQTEHQRAELLRQQETVVAAIAAGLDHLSQGDLTTRLNQTFATEYEKLRADFNATAASLNKAMGTIATATSGIGQGSDQIASASDDLSRRTEQQAASLEQTAATLNVITETVKAMAKSSSEAAEVVLSTRAAAETSGAVVHQAVETMSRIKESSHRISNIIGVIDEIAFQTNLLALNAGVEAARAGDAGRGFAVVASEVRGLAQRSAEAAKEIKTLISASTEQVESGVMFVDKTGIAFRDIATKLIEIDALVRQISSSSREQANGLVEINTAVRQMDQVVQQNAAMVEESTAAAQALRSETQNLSTMVGHFQIEGHARPNPVHAARDKIASGFNGARPKLKAAGAAARQPAAATNDWDAF